MTYQWRTRLRWAGLVLLLGSVLAPFLDVGLLTLLALLMGPPAGVTLLPAGVTLLALSPFVGLRSPGVSRLVLLTATGGAIGAINSLLSACVTLGFFFLRGGDTFRIDDLLSIVRDTAPCTAIFGLIVGVWISLLQAYPPGFCQRCGYDLRGTPGRCPECGGAFDPSSPRTYTTPRWREALVIFLIVCVCVVINFTIFLAFLLPIHID